MGVSHQKQVEENKSPHHGEEEKTTIPPVKEEQDNEDSLTHRDQEEQTANSEDEIESAEKSTLESTPIQNPRHSEMGEIPNLIKSNKKARQMGQQCHDSKDRARICQ